MTANTRLDTLRMMLDMSMRQAALGVRIREARKEKGWKQRQLAAQIPGREGVSVDTQTVSRWERGTHSPDLETLQVVADALGKPLSFFVAEESEKTPELGALVEQLAEATTRLVSLLERLEAQAPSPKARTRAQG